MSADTNHNEKGLSSDEASTTTPETETPPPPPPAPDGGFKAWSVAIGAASITFSTLGFANSSGTLIQHYISHQLSDYSADDIAWIASVTLFLQFAIGMVAGPLFDRYGAIILRPVTIAYVFSVMMLSLCREYYQFMLCQGVLMGICQGLLQLPSMAAASQWFDKKRGAALGVVIAGSSIGGVIFPILLSKLLNGTNLGFGWSIRIIGFLMVPFMAFATATVVPRLPGRKTNIWTLSALKNAQFLIVVVSFGMCLIGMFTPIFFLPTYAVSRGLDATFAGYLLAIVNGASTFGRIIPGILADKFGRINMVVLAGVTSGICVFCLSSVTGVAGFVIYSIVFGFCSGSIFSASLAAITGAASDPSSFGAYMGMGMALVAIGPLIGPPIDGALVARYGGFEEVSYFGGAVCVAGGLIAIAAKALRPEGVFGRA